MKPMRDIYGIDLGAIDAPPAGDRPTPACPGARLRLTRHDARELVKAGEVFRSDGTNLPVEGYGDARVRCDGFVEVGPRGVSGVPVVYGLCASCQRAEEYNRAMLRERQGSQR